MPYSDYFAIDEKYHPVINQNTMEDPASRWQDTYPHTTFVKLLKQSARMLGRGDSSAKKPIWIHGVYGTGKSRLAWTLRELLTCSANELIAYFNDYEELRKEAELREKLLGLKQGDRIVVAMRYDSSDINGLNDLVVTIYESVCEALKKRGMNYLEESSLAHAIINWLDNQTNRNILTQILKEDRYKSDGDLADTGEAVRERLLAGGNNANLLKKLLQIGHEVKLTNLTFTVDTLTQWLEGVIKANNLTALVFIWDEFSDFLNNNRHIYGAFQKLAEISEKIPFYFIIVTHFTANMFAEDDPSARVTMDRFNRLQIELPEYTAFKLIGHALKVREGQEEEWDQMRDDINSRLEQARRDVKKMVPALDMNDFKNIMPIQPYAALILKNVAQYFDSNQRSMFDFIAVNDKETKAFQYFINTFGPEDGEVLSIDHLWDYFYISGKGKLGYGRDSLQTNIRAIMDSYPLLGEKYAQEADADGRKQDSPEQRVLKTVIILQALRTRSPQIEHFRANEENLETAFCGIDALAGGQGRMIADKLVEDKVLFKDQGIYQVPLGAAIDQSKILDIVKEFRRSLSTSKLLPKLEAWQILPPSEPLKARLAIRKLSERDFNRDLARFVNEKAKSWEMKFILCFARNPIEADAVHNLIQQALENNQYNNIYFIDATAETMPEHNWEDYLQACARERHFSTISENAQAEREKSIAEQIIKDWQEQIKNGKFSLYSASLNRAEHFPRGEDLLERIKDLVQEKYPACYDFADGTRDPHFKKGGGPGFIGAGIAAKNSGTLNAECVSRLVKDIQAEKYWELASDHPLAKLRKSLAKKASKAFSRDGSGRLDILEIIEDFMSQGFMPVLLYAWLSGYLLKEFADNKYRYSDGETGGEMNAERLASMIDSAFKKIQHPDFNYRPQYIEVMTQEQRAFADLARKLFNLEGNEDLGRVSSKICDLSRLWGYPFWAFSYLPEAPRWDQFIRLLLQFLNPEAHGRGSYGEVASDLGKIILNRAEAEEELARLFTQENLHQGMLKWLENYQNGEIPLLAREIGVIDPLKDIRENISADQVWLWNQDTFENSVLPVLWDYRLAAESVRKGYLSHARSREDCLEGWRQKLYHLHVPAALLKERYSSERAVIKALEDLAKGKNFTQTMTTTLYEAIHKDNSLQDIFNNAYDFFKTIYADKLKNLPEKNISNLYARLLASSFREDKIVFENELQTRIREIEEKLKRGQLLDVWRKLTGYDSPNELAMRLKTPYAHLLREIFGDEKCGEGIAAIRIVENENATEAEIEKSLKFITANTEDLRQMTDQSVADRAFRKFIIGKNGAILTDLDQVRSWLNGKLGENVNRWLDNPAWQEHVHDLASEEYKSKGLLAVRKKLEKMSADEAKDLLASLGEDSFEVGMRILAE